MSVINDPSSLPEPGDTVAGVERVFGGVYVVTFGSGKTLAVHADPPGGEIDCCSADGAGGLN